MTLRAYCWAWMLLQITTASYLLGSLLMILEDVPLTPCANDLQRAASTHPDCPESINCPRDLHKLRAPQEN